MSLPASWDTVRVFATYKKFSDGLAAEGAVTFDPVTIVTLPEGGGRTIVMPEPRTVVLDASGKIDILLPATDDPDLAPATGLIYKVTERIAPTNRTYYIQVATCPRCFKTAPVRRRSRPRASLSARSWTSRPTRRTRRRRQPRRGP